MAITPVNTKFYNARIQAGALIKEEENSKYAFANAGYLFFASNPRKRFANAFVRVLKYDICDEDTTPTTVETL